MSKIIKQDELARLLAKNTGFYIKNMNDVVTALEEIIMETLHGATLKENSEIQLATGIIIGGKRIPERESVDPRDGSPIIAAERVRPYVTFKDSVKRKLREQPKRKRKK